MIQTRGVIAGTFFIFHLISSLSREILERELARSSELMGKGELVLVSCE